MTKWPSEPRTAATGNTDMVVLPEQVQTAKEFNDMAGGMVKNLGALECHCHGGGGAGSGCACRLARNLQPLAIELFEHFECSTLEQLPADGIVPPELVQQLMELKAEYYDPYMQEPNQVSA